MTPPTAPRPLPLSRPTHLVQRQLLAGAAAAGSGAARPPSHKAEVDARVMEGAEGGEVARLVGRVDSLARRVSADSAALHHLPPRLPHRPLDPPPLALAASARLLPPEQHPHTQFQADASGEGEGEARGVGGADRGERGGPGWSAGRWECRDGGGDEVVVGEAGQQAAGQVRQPAPCRHVRARRLRAAGRPLSRARLLGW
jgi:hypothetical protein